MLKDKDMQISIYSLLYKIPEKHTLRLLKDELDFSFINEQPRIYQLVQWLIRSMRKNLGTIKTQTSGFVVRGIRLLGEN